MDSSQRLFLIAAVAVLIFTVLKWVRMLRRLDATIQAAREKARRGEVSGEPQEAELQGAAPQGAERREAEHQGTERQEAEPQDSAPQGNEPGHGESRGDGSRDDECEGVQPQDG